MKFKKIQALFPAFVLAFSMLAGCGSNSSDTKKTTAAPSTESVISTKATSTEKTSTEAASTEKASAEADSAENTSEKTSENVSENASADIESDNEPDNEADAKQLLIDLTGSYQELWPVILDEQYTQIWLDDCKELVGEENAQAAYEKLASMVTGEVYGEDAVKAYADGGGAYYCAFTEGVNTLEFDGSTSTIKGFDKNGNELFSHTYHFVGMEEIRGLYEYESDDDDSGEFTYFCIAPDTNTTTYHIELRYGSDLEALGKYDAGDYAYWLGSGISTDYDQTMVENCIELFCTENLSE